MDLAVGRLDRLAQELLRRAVGEVAIEGVGRRARRDLARLGAPPAVRVDEDRRAGEDRVLLGGPAAAGPFTLLRFAEPALPDIVYLEPLTGAAYLDNREDLDAHTTVMDQMAVQALPPAETTAFLPLLAVG